MPIKSNRDSTVFQPTRGRWQWQLFGGAFGALIALTLLPQTGWIVRKQFGLPATWSMVRSAAWEAIYNGSTWDMPHSGRGQLHQNDPILIRAGTAATLRNDVAVQVAHALQQVEEVLHPSGSGLALQQVRELQAKYASSPDKLRMGLLKNVLNDYGSDPMAYAVYLRYATKNIVFIDRKTSRWVNNRAIPIDDLGSSDYKEPVLRQGRPPVVAASVREFENLAQRGERLEPDNAFFPTMLALAHFVEKRDKEGLDDVARAAQKPRWNDYINEEVRGGWKLEETAFGRQSALIRLVQAMSYRYPHYGHLQPLAKLVVWYAVQQERAGNREAGLALRGRLMRIAATIGEQCSHPMQANTGAGLLQTAATLQAADTDPALFRKRLQSFKPGDAPVSEGAFYYYTYLKAHHFDAEAEWFQQQSLYFDELNRIAMNTEIGMETPLLLSWLGNLLLLAQIVGMVFLGGILAIRGYRRRFQVEDRRSYDSPVAVGGVLGFFFGIGLLLFLAGGESEALHSVWWFFVTAPLIPAIVMSVTLRQARKLITSALRMALCTLTLLLAVRCQMGRYCFDAGIVNALDTNDVSRQTLALCAWMETLGALITPLLMVYVLSVRNWLRRAPATTGMARSFASGTLPVLTVLILGYVLSIFWTERVEAQAAIRLEQRVRNWQPQALSLSSALRRR